MRIAFFGGSFDPPHRGHLAIARAAIARLDLDLVLLAPVATQPLKHSAGHAGFEDRLAMVRLAVEDDPRLRPCSADAPLPGGAPNYTLDTLTRLRENLASNDVLFCLVGADSFLTIKQWHRSVELLLFCDFIVAGRPGFSLEEVAAALPAEVEIRGQHREPEFIRLDLAAPPDRRSSLFLLPDLDEDISATEIRSALAGGSNLESYLAPKVTAYIRAHGLYHSVHE